MKTAKRIKLRTRHYLAKARWREFKTKLTGTLSALFDAAPMPDEIVVSPQLYTQLKYAGYPELKSRIWLPL